MTAAATKKPIPGDVFEVLTPKGCAYIQYVLKTERMGELIRVLPGLFPARPPSFGDLAAQKERYFVYFPLTGIVRGRGVHFVGHEPIPPGSAALPRTRRPGGRTRDGRALNWWLTDGHHERRVDRLSDHERDLSLEVTWNLALLVERLASGWVPRDDIGMARDAPEGRAVDQGTMPDDNTEEVREVVHYIYFASDAQAQQFKQALERDGYSVDVSPSAAEESWVCIVREPAVSEPEAVASVGERLSDLAVAYGGEYDGEEVRTERHRLA